MFNSQFIPQKLPVILFRLNTIAFFVCLFIFFQSRNVEEAVLAVVAARKREFSEASQSLSEEREPFDELTSSEGSDIDEDTPFSPEAPSRQQGHFAPIANQAQGSQNTTPRRRTVPRINLYRKVEAPVEHDWTAAVKTSVDWKSVSCPALLPLTTDFSPSKKTLDTNYLEYNYTVYIEEDEDFTEDKKNSDWGKQDR